MRCENGYYVLKKHGSKKKMSIIFAQSIHIETDPKMDVLDIILHSHTQYS